MGSSLQNAGLTPQQAIVNPDGTPTMFFFRWLLSMKGAAITAADVEILEAFADGSLDAAFANVLAAAGETFLASQFAGEGPAAGELGARLRELEAGASFAGGAAAWAGAIEARLTELEARMVIAGALRDEENGDRYALEALMGAPAPAPAAAAPALVIVDTLANWTLANYNPANYAQGQQFLVSTWNVTYTVVGGVWAYTSGTYIALAAARPVTGFNGALLGAADTGLQFLASDTNTLQYWNGAVWVPINPSPITVTNFTPVIQIGGSSTGIALNVVRAMSTMTGSGTGAPVTVFLNIIITAWPASPVGTVTISGLPTLPIAARGNGTFNPATGFVGLTGPIFPALGNTGIITLNVIGATGQTPVSPTVFAVNSAFGILITYLSA